MAFEIHWQIRFKSLRDKTDYTVSIYKDGTPPSGYPLTLKGSANPFSTDESADDDVFSPLRTQTGYLGIADDGLAVNMSSEDVDFDWRDMLPTTDTDRPVTLTHDENGTDVIDWQGFLQAQNFDGNLYGNPQERSLPIQCALETLGRIDIDPTAYDGVRSFADILDYALSQVPALTFSHIYIQGGADAMAWLQKKFDWMLFAEVDGAEDTIDGKYTVQEVLSGMCRYWGWTMRTRGQDIYLTCPDDTSVSNFLFLTRQQLAGYPSNGTGTIDTGGYGTKAIGNVFASTNNTDTISRGYNKAVVKSEVGDIDENIVFEFPESFLKTMDDMGYVTEQSGVAYTRDVNSLTSVTMFGTCPHGGGSFNIMKYSDIPNVINKTYKPVIRMGTYQTYGFASIQSTRMHNFTDGEFTIKGDSYRTGEKTNETLIFTLRIGISLETAKWWDGTQWVSQQAMFYARHLGNDNTYYTYNPSDTNMNTLCSVISTDGLSSPYGYVFLNFLGGVSTGSSYDFELADFSLSFSRPDDPTKYIDKERHDSIEYRNKNEYVVSEEWSADTIFATENYSKFGPGVVLNANNSYFKGWNYAGHTDASTLAPKPSGYQAIDLTAATQPEQHLANRVVRFWSRARRKIECELRQDLSPDILPTDMVTLDGTTLYAYSVSREWRDDIVKLKLMEI